MDVEDLHIKGMVKNHKLAQAISDSEALASLRGQSTQEISPSSFPLETRRRLSWSREDLPAQPKEMNRQEGLSNGQINLEYYIVIVFVTSTR